MQGLAVVPLFAGFDLDAEDPAAAGRVFSYDVTGSCAEENGYASVGSGSIFAKAALKKRYRPASAEDTIVRTLVEALYDAADDDTATGGPDLTRRLFPIVTVVDADGVRRLSTEQVGAVATAVVADRMSNPGG
jgi:proteasome beta subunit